MEIFTKRELKNYWLIKDLKCPLEVVKFSFIINKKKEIELIINGLIKLIKYSIRMVSDSIPLALNVDIGTDEVSVNLYGYDIQKLLMFVSMDFYDYLFKLDHEGELKFDIIEKENQLKHIDTPLVFAHDFLHVNYKFKTPKTI
ncbi:MAG: hypothetical protein FJX80_06740 [Bacteroidetes bacterium]|nr:hypothetical protein [Bacteroidota bacterium]